MTDNLCFERYIERQPLRCTLHNNRKRNRTFPNDAETLAYDKNMKPTIFNERVQYLALLLYFRRSHSQCPH